MLERIVTEVLNQPLSVEFTGRNHYCGMVDGRIYRVVKDPGSVSFYQELFGDTEWMMELFRLGMVKTALLGVSQDGFLVLEHEYLRYRPMFHEWTWQQAKDLATMIIRLQKHLYLKGCFLSDPHVFNVTFTKSRPVYYDFGSITPGEYSLGEWIRNFWLSQTRAASWLWSLKLTYAELQDFLYHPTMGTLEAQMDGVEKLERRVALSEWSHYDKKDFCAEDSSTYKAKHKAVRDLVLSLPEVPATALEVGCNTGDFCKMLHHLGVQEICGVDVDEASVEKLYLEARGRNLPIDCLTTDLFGLFGWHAVDFGADGWEKQYRPLRRLPSDLVVAVALVHHLCYFRNQSFELVAQVLSEFSKKYLIVEWIPNTDKYLSGPINQHGVDKSWYTEENFVEVIKRYFPCVLVNKPSTDDRKMYLFAKEM